MNNTDFTKMNTAPTATGQRNTYTLNKFGPENDSFYRAMLCIARTMPWQDVCLSVCCHTPVSKRLNIFLNVFTVW